MLNVGVAIRFTPPEVVKAVYQCLEEVSSPLEAGNVTVCLTIHKSSLDQLGEFSAMGPVLHPLIPHLEVLSPILRSEWSQKSKSHLHIHPAASVTNMGPFPPLLPTPRHKGLSQG